MLKIKEFIKYGKHPAYVYEDFEKPINRNIYILLIL
jgi:hypothetical protein